ncbi:hypothetical protein AMATHDRAFT_158602 [Amanita thiersii Skay4041]|uniref:Uncharacterized protein n=1 Tax=Amanita thiersii Skay4041 TaxID=703135 RepID=A0A2A9ND92_9AGAR|nr:hypothetical protein AMATHDRAFT_158602 [Amanita thiersii Skay4041]
MTPRQDATAEFHSWYEEEHLPLLSRVPGWGSSCRYTLLDHHSEEPPSAAVATVNTSDLLLPETTARPSFSKPPSHLALHTYTSPASFVSKEYHDAVSTPWRNKIVEGSVAERERYVFTYIGILDELPDISA